MDPTQLSKEQKLQLLDYIQEKKRRAKAARANYIPNAGQQKVHNSTAPIRALFCGNGSGKTALGVNEALWHALGYNPVTKEFLKVPCDIIVVLDQPAKVEDVWIKELRKWCNLEEEFDSFKHGKPFVSELRRKGNGSSIKFMFHGSEPMLFESIECDVVIYDEPPPRHVFIALARGGRKKGRKAKHLFICTPISQPWLRMEILEPWAKGERDDIECFKYGTEVNKANLADNYIQDFSRNLSEKEKKIRLEGEFFDLSGLALAHLWKPEYHIIPKDKLPEIELAVIAIDPHPEKNHVACLMGTCKDGYLYYLDEIASNALARDYAKLLKPWYEKYKLFDIVCDSLGQQKMTSGEGHKSFIDVLNEAGIPVRSTSYEDKKNDIWITRIQDALRLPDSPDNFGVLRPKFRVVEGNNGIIRDIETVAWEKYKNVDLHKPKLDIADKDFLACLKYALATNLAPNRKNEIYRISNMESVYGLGIKSPWSRKKKEEDFF